MPIILIGIGAIVRAPISSETVPAQSFKPVFLPPYVSGVTDAKLAIAAPLYFQRKIGYAPKGGDGKL